MSSKTPFPHILIAQEQLDALKAEVERLKAHHKIAVDNWTLEAQITKQLEHEIERLKSELLKAQQESIANRLNIVKEAFQVLEADLRAEFGISVGDNEIILGDIDHHRLFELIDAIVNEVEEQMRPGAEDNHENS